MKKRILTVVLALLMLMPLALPTSSGERAPTVFIEDQVWYKYDRYELFDIGGVTYAPAVLFSSVPLCSVSYVEEHSVMLIRSGEGFVSFDFSADAAWDSQGVRKAVKCYQRSGEWYLPFEYVCESLGVFYEILRADGQISVRVGAEQSELSFAELRELYTSTDALTVADPDLETHGKAKPRRIYIGLYLELGEDTAALLDLLEEENVLATFFIEPESAQENTDLLYEIAGRGHSIGIDYGRTLPDELDGIASLIFKVTKRRCRILGHGRLTHPDVPSGYVLQGAGHDLADETQRMNEDMLNNHIKTLYYNAVTVFSFYSTQDAQRYIPALVENNNSTADFMPMTSVGIFE